jgi:hypothetical protein
MTIPRSVNRVIDEQTRVTAEITGTLNQLAYMYGPGTEKVMDAVDRAIAAERSRIAEESARRGFQREVATRLRWAQRALFRKVWG